MTRFSMRFGALMFFSVLASVCAAQAGGFSVLYTFQGGSDGANPSAGPIKDKAGNLYGTTVRGGGSGCGGYGCGTIWKLAPDGTETVLHALAGGSEGANPVGGLNVDKLGNLYGVTQAGGNTSCGGGGCGTVYKLATDGSFEVLHTFMGPPDGQMPFDGLLSGGVRYGTTESGGDASCSPPSGCGTIYKIARNGTESVVYSFQGGSDGANPFAAPIRDKAGNLYGTTGADTIWKLAPNGTLSTLYTLTGGSEGGGLSSSLLLDPAGNLYGTATSAGDVSCNQPVGCGTVFELAPDGTFTVLYTFDSDDGQGPSGALVRDSKGHLYGVTSQGGLNNGPCYFGCGVVYEVSPVDGGEAVLHAFTDGSDGASPYGALLPGADGYLYGTASNGGAAGYGTVYKVLQFP